MARIRTLQHTSCLATNLKSIVQDYAELAPIYVNRLEYKKAAFDLQNIR